MQIRQCCTISWSYYRNGVLPAAGKNRYWNLL